MPSLFSPTPPSAASYSRPRRRGGTRGVACPRSQKGAAGASPENPQDKGSPLPSALLCLFS
eukprot:9237370-Pyramimonas_sp.AAC.1